MISFLLAMDRNRVIGKDNDMPWHLPADLAYFKKTTMGHPIVMGRKTHEAIGKALPGRRNVIVTRNPAYKAEGCEVVHSVDEAVALFRNDEEVFVIGGAQLFEAFFSYADRLYITCIDDSFAGDTYFPKIVEDEWQKISDEKGGKDEKNPYPFAFLVYERKSGL